ncbi:type II toxin-antitoxin system VapC family toxin [Nonomuraea basaltis]|uniref:type II toxin-antitoxin system VapC family toxin n=1 Tax=Nonomuraea basaltis TaxID=2495887 RepID=UPI00110C541C|nr:type II toxin-antitoxin system VapC family toxin [Nonomuraea basaltis]TMR90175.1 type II toxin-antitoxin system VapC family toxin [Nonomuraea basaltis]
MGRRVRRADVPFPTPLFVLDAQPYSLLGEDDPRVVARIAVAREEGFIPAISVVTLAEVRRTGAVGRRLIWQRAHLTVIPVTEAVADVAGTLLEGTGLDGHERVVDALVVASAAVGSGPAKVASSDGSHIPKLISEARLRRDSPIAWVPV